MKLTNFLLIFTVFWMTTVGCHSQNKGGNMQSIDRKPAVAGQFYPADSASLQKSLENLFVQAKPGPTLNLRAIIVPHAGYIFSGKVAASGFNQIPADMKYENIFIIGPSHRAAWDGASVYDRGDYITPLGKATVNTQLASELIKKYSFFSYRQDADAYEHDIEVQIPFLQKHLKNPFKIVPIIIGTDSPETLKKIASALKPWFNPNNLFVISTDFSHYPSFEDAVNVDRVTAQAICTNSPQNLLDTLISNRKKHISGLSTSLCGSSAVFTLLYITFELPGIEIKDIDYQNSGHSPYGDQDHVVGYHAMTITQKLSSNDFSLTDTDKKNLLKIARQSIEQYFKTKTRLPKPDALLTPNLLKPCGAFVTLHKHGELRGCIGHFGEDKPLWETVAEMALASAFNDTRFYPLSEEELREIEIEISVLTPMRKISSINEIQLGKHGIYIKKGWRSGTFLPQVATETGWTLEEFLGHCSRDKAGLGWDGWKDAEIYVYEAIVFSEKEF